MSFMSDFKSLFLSVRDIITIESNLLFAAPPLLAADSRLDYRRG
jgi:hypothetical protein